MNEFNYENAEGAENRTRKLNEMLPKNRMNCACMGVCDGTTPETTAELSLGRLT